MEDQNKELNEILQSLKLECEEEINRKEAEILKAKDRIHLLNTDLIKLDHINDNKDYVREMINKYYSNHHKPNLGSKYKINFNKVLREKLNTAISQLE